GGFPHPSRRGTGAVNYLAPRWTDERTSSLNPAAFFPPGLMDDLTPRPGSNIQASSPQQDSIGGDGSIRVSGGGQRASQMADSGLDGHRATRLREVLGLDRTESTGAVPDVDR